MESKPTVIALVETLIEEDENIEIERYPVVYPMKPCTDQSENKRGTLVAVCNELKHVVKMADNESTIGQQTWIDLDNGKPKIRIGVLYGPQE